MNVSTYKFFCVKVLDAVKMAEQLASSSSRPSSRNSQTSSGGSPDIRKHSVDKKTTVVLGKQTLAPHVTGSAVSIL